MDEQKVEAMEVEVGPAEADTKGGALKETISEENKSSNDKETKKSICIEEMVAGGEILCEEGRFVSREIPIIPEKKVKTPADDSDYQRRKLRGKKKWEWKRFKNSARNDDFELCHWQKSGQEVIEYPYAAFNTRLERIEYTEEHYERYLQDPLWTMADTDHLMELCYQLDLRWPVIVDRYSVVPGRPLEQLQARYYFVAHTLAERGLLKHKEKELPGALRKTADEDPAIGISIRTRDFDVSYEEKRRRQLHGAFCRTKAEEAEEKALRDELKQVELESKRLKKSTRALAQAAAEQRRLDHTARAGAQVTGVTHYTQGDTSLVSSQQEKEDQQPTENVFAKKEIQQRPRPVGNRQVGATTVATQQHTAQRGPDIIQHRRPVPGQPFLQSARLRLPESQPGGLSHGMLTKLSLVLEELGVPNRPLPTKLACDAYDQLRRDIVTLLSLQKLANNKQIELNKLRAQLDDPRRHAPPPPIPPAPTAAPAPPRGPTGGVIRNPTGNQQQRQTKSTVAHPGKKAGEKQVKPSTSQKRKHKETTAPVSAPTSAAPTGSDVAANGGGTTAPRPQKRARKQQVKHDV